MENDELVVLVSNKKRPVYRKNILWIVELNSTRSRQETDESKKIYCRMVGGQEENIRGKA